MAIHQHIEIGLGHNQYADKSLMIGDNVSLSSTLESIRGMRMLMHPTNGLQQETFGLPSMTGVL